MKKTIITAILLATSFSSMAAKYTCFVTDGASAHQTLLPDYDSYHASKLAFTVDTYTGEMKGYINHKFDEIIVLVEADAAQVHNFMGITGLNTGKAYGVEYRQFYLQGGKFSLSSKYKTVMGTCF